MKTFFSEEKKPVKEGSLLNDRYIVYSFIKESNISRIYKAIDNNTGEFIIIKEMFLEHILNPAEKSSAEEQFQTEADILLNLVHSNIPEFRDFFTFNGKKYIVMEYIEGETIKEMISNNSNFLSNNTVINLAINLCNVLEYLHSRKPRPVIYRSLCHENIIISKDGTIKLIDFGLSKIFNPQEHTTAVAKDAKLYFSPMEQYIWRTDERSDIYSFGAIIYYCITKQCPVDAIERTIDGKKLPPCREFNPDTDPVLEKIILKALELEQDNRYENITIIKRELERILNKDKGNNETVEIKEEVLTKNDFICKTDSKKNIVINEGKIDYNNVKLPLIDKIKKKIAEIYEKKNRLLEHILDSILNMLLNFLRKVKRRNGKKKG